MRSADVYFVKFLIFLFSDFILLHHGPGVQFEYDTKINDKTHF